MLAAIALEPTVERLPAPRSALELFELVEDLPVDSTGELVFSGPEEVGVVFVEASRICWAAARGLSRRLVDLLRASSARQSPGSLEALYRRAKSEGRPFGELLVTQGIVAPQQLREALRTHTLESIERILSERASVVWVPRRGAGYSPRFTFSSLELLTALARRSDPALVARATEVLEATLESGDCGIALARGGAIAEPAPVALFGDVPPRARVIIDAGKWATSALDLGDAIAQRRSLFAARSDVGGFVVAWRARDLAFVAACDELRVGRILRRITSH